MNESPTPKRLLRSRDDRYIGGVAAGVAKYFSIDPTLVRVIFLVSLAFGGIGMLAYFALLLMMPIEGSPDEPLPEVSKQRRNLMIAAAVVFGSAVVLTIGSGGFTEWIFGFAPGAVFGILLWSVTLIAAIWLVSKIISSQSSGSSTAATEADAPPPGAPAPAPSQNAPTAVMAAEAPAEPSTAESPTEVMDPEPESPDPVSGDAPHGPTAATAAAAAPARPGSSAGAVAGKVMTVIAVGITALIGLSMLAILATWTTAQFGGVPMALLVIVLGGGMILAGVQGRRRLSIWLLAAALTVTIPMSIVTLADLRIDGTYGSVTETPTLFSDIPSDGYSLAAGRMIVDLRELPFRRDETVDVKVDSGLGMTSVIVPDRVCVAGRVTGRAGLADVRGREFSGIDISRELRPPHRPAPRVELDADFKLGVVEVIDATDWESSVRFRGDEYGRSRGFETNRWDRDFDSSASRKRADAACMTKAKPKPKPRSTRN